MTEPNPSAPTLESANAAEGADAANTDAPALSTPVAPRAVPATTEFQPIDAFLGVSRSVTGNRWVARKADEEAAAEIAARTGLPAPVARALASRHVKPDAVGHFLEPKLRDAMPDPSHLLDMDTAVDRTIAALLTEEKIALFADFDVDGATSSAQVRRFFRALGQERCAATSPTGTKRAMAPRSRA